MAIDPRHTSTPRTVPSTPAVAKPVAPLESSAESSAESTAASSAATTTPASAPAERRQTDAAKKKLAQSTHKAPIASTTSSQGNVRGALLGHLSEARQTTEQRHFLRTAWKELDKPGAHLIDHIALRDMAREHGVVDAFDAILVKHAATLLPQVIEQANVFAGATELKKLAALASAMGERDAFDVHVSEQLTVARAWAKDDDDRALVEGVAHALGLSFVPEEAKAEKPKRIVTEEIEAVKKSRRLITKHPQSWAGYQKVLQLLANGEAGHNQHSLGRDLAGLWAADLPGSGAGRGAMRIVYELDGDRVVIKDVVDYH